MFKIKLKQSLMTKIFGAFLFVTLVPIVLTAWLTYKQAYGYLMENMASSLKGISEIKKHFMQYQIREIKFRVENAASSRLFIETAAAAASTLSEAKERENALIELRNKLEKILGEGNVFEEVFFVSPQGNILVSTVQTNEGKNVGDREYFVNGKTVTFFQSAFLSHITGKLTVVVSSPVKKEGDNEITGVLAARLNLQGFYRIIYDVTGLGNTGETYLGYLQNEEVVFLCPTRHDKNAALNVRFRIGDVRGIPIQKAVQGEEGSDVVTDYRNKKVIAVWSLISGVNWGMVTKIDYDEFEEPIRRWEINALFLGIIMVLVSSVLAFVLSLRIIIPIKKLSIAAERVSLGETDVKIEVKSKDEIGRLADSFERMLTAIKFFKEDKK